MAMQPGHRDTKTARTRLAFLDAFVSRLDHRPTEEIPVRELCAEVGVSEPTFFNLFDGKADLIVFFIQLWSIGLGVRARETLAGSGAKAAIREIFADTARSVAAHPRIMGEIIAAQARLSAPRAARPVSLAERRLRFGEDPRFDDVPGEGLDALLPWLIEEAVKGGELPAGTDEQLLLLNLAAVFFGTPTVLRAIDPALVGPMWQRQLDLLLEHA